jgi:hypothetical protein
MVADLERRVDELRFVNGIEKVEHVPYTTGDQFWVRFNQPLDLTKLDEIVKKRGLMMIKFAGLPSHLPRGLAEMLSDGVTHVITNGISGWSKFTSKLGFEPDGIAKLAVDLHGPYRIFMTTDEQGIQLLYEYLGLNYVPPAPPAPKPAAPAKPTTPPAAKAPQPTPSRPATPPTPSGTGSLPKSQPSQSAVNASGIPISEQTSAETKAD